MSTRTIVDTNRMLNEDEKTRYTSMAGKALLTDVVERLMAAATQMNPLTRISIAIKTAR
jgi:hypothetical protein